MLDNLIESKKKSARSAGGTLLSVVVHAAVIALAVVVTANAGLKKDEKVKAEDITFMETPKEKPPPPEPEKPPPPDVVVTPPPPKGFQTIVAPIDIPDKIPEPDLSKAVTDAADFSGTGVAGGTSKGVVGGTAKVSDQPYFVFQVEKPALAREGNPTPPFPEILRQSGITGQVVAEFVVGTDGKADMSTFHVLSSTHDLFTAAVKRTLPKMSFYPAEIGGQKVKQLVSQAFTFAIE
jgi:protein TonB